MNAECGDGSFTTIEKDANEQDIPTPYDSTLIVLSDKLNHTYITYGYDGVKLEGAFHGFDTVAVYDLKDINKVMNYRVVRSDGRLYDKSGWDLVDAYTKDSTIIQKIDLKTLPKNLQQKSKSELTQIVKSQINDRRSLKDQISTVSEERKLYLASEKNKQKIVGHQTLETEIEKIIRLQVKRFKMTIQ